MSAAPQRTRHTPEPWEFDFITAPGTFYQAYSIQAVDPLSGDLVRVVARTPTSDGAETEANAARIVACVNACAELDPAAIPSLAHAAETLLNDREYDIAWSDLRAALAAVRGGQK